MKTEYLSQIQKAFVDLMECIEVKSDHPSDPSRLAVRMKFSNLSTYFCRLYYAAYLRIGSQYDCCEGLTALFDQLMTGSEIESETLLFSCTQQYLFGIGYL